MADIDEEVRDESQDTSEQPDHVEDDASHEEEFDLDRAKSKISKANKEAAGLRRRLRELEPLAAKAKELEDRDKTEAQRATEAGEQARREAAEARAEAIRLRVAMRYGLAEEDLDLLGVGDEDQIDARAKRLAERFNAKDDRTAPEPRRRPQERLRAGAVPGVDPKELDGLSPMELLRLSHQQQ